MSSIGISLKALTLPLLASARYAIDSGLLYCLLRIELYMFNLSQLQVLVQATMDVYKRAMDEFLPTPTKSHYVFNLRDFARVIYGVLLVPSTHLQEGDKLIRLWIHEVYRVFYDRLTADEDRLVSMTFAIILGYCHSHET